jgi:HAD superfamily hydrolase (TIGR01509 family)
LLAEMAGRPDAPPEPRQRAALAGELHTRKNRLYAQCVARGQVLARPGVLAVMHDLAVRGVTQGIVTTTSRVNVQVLMACLLGPDWRDLFRTVLCGEDCARKKPDPQIYQLALQTLAIDPLRALAIEDAKAGVMAARGAGLWVLWRPGQYDLGAVPEDAHVRRLAAGAEFTVASLPGGPALERDGGLSGRGSFGPAL